jgi:hypothetical protein
MLRFWISSCSVFVPAIKHPTKLLPGVAADYHSVEVRSAVGFSGDAEEWYIHGQSPVLPVLPQCYPHTNPGRDRAYLLDLALVMQEVKLMEAWSCCPEPERRNLPALGAAPCRFSAGHGRSRRPIQLVQTMVHRPIGPNLAAPHSGAQALETRHGSLIHKVTSASIPCLCRNVDCRVSTSVFVLILKPSMETPAQITTCLGYTYNTCTARHHSVRGTSTMYP